MEPNGIIHINKIFTYGSSQRIKIYFGNFVFIAVLNGFLFGLWSKNEFWLSEHLWGLTLAHRSGDKGT